MSKEAGAAEISSQLDAAIEEEIEETESPAVEAEGEDNEDRPRGKTIPYSRFKQVNDSRKHLESKYEELERSYRDQTDSLARLTEMLDQVKEDAQIVERIRSLANDPNMLPHIEVLDKKLKGIEDDIEETGKVDNKKVDAARRILEKQQAELASELADQRSDLLVNRADAIADKWLDSLPGEYTAQDREIISRLWADEVEDHWDDIESDPSALQPVLTQTFQKVINDFGVPRGALIDPSDPDSYEIEIDEEDELSPEEELVQKIYGKNYGAVKEQEVGGKKVLLPEISDDEFTADLAKVLRARS